MRAVVFSERQTFPTLEDVRAARTWSGRGVVEGRVCGRASFRCGDLQRLRERRARFALDGPAVEAQTDVVRPTAAEYAASRDRTIDGVLSVDELVDDFLAWRGAFHGIVALKVNHHLDWRDPESIFLRHLGASIRALVSPAAPHTRERPRLAAQSCANHNQKTTKEYTMPKGYIVYTKHVTDPEGIAAYSAAAAPSAIAAGGTVVIAGPAQRVVEGAWHGDITVVLEFPSLDAANAWYDGPEYQAVIDQRHQAAVSNVARFEGFVPPSPTQ